MRGRGEVKKESGNMSSQICGEPSPVGGKGVGVQNPKLLRIT